MRHALDKFMNVKLKYPILPLLAFLVQFLASRLSGSLSELDVRRAGLLLSYLLLIVFLAFNRRYLGMLVVAAGLLMNMAAILANGGLMPVSAGTAISAGQEEQIAVLQSGDVVPGTNIVLLDRSQTRLWLLSDIFSIRFPFKGVFSIGDIFVLVGAVLVVVQLALCAWGRSISPPEGRTSTRPALQAPSAGGRELRMGGP